MDRRLVEAAVSGNETTLNALIYEDPLILHRVSLTSFDDTPLHVAALYGNLDFVTAILTRKPGFLTKSDSFGRCPLHLACAEGHVEAVKKPFQACPEVSKRRDQDGRTPLDLAALNEQVEVLTYLLRENPLLAKMAALDGRETILHLCVRYNCLRALKLLVDCWSRNEVINSEDDDGNNLLHFAVIHKQIETVKYLLGDVAFGGKWNSLNKNGFTAVDVLDHCPRDWRSLELQDILMRAGVRRAKDLKHLSEPPPLDSLPSSKNLFVSQETTCTSSLSHPGKLRKFLRKAWNHHLRNENNWVEQIRGNLLVTATLIATISFQAGLNPPGGVWQDSSNGHIAGTSIIPSREIDYYFFFVLYNTIAFISSLSIILLMISGFPLKSKAFVGVLMLAMCVTIVFMLGTYNVSVLKVLTPKDMPRDQFYRIELIIYVAMYSWYGVCAVVVLFHAARFSVWLLKKVPRHEEGRRLKRIRNEFASPFNDDSNTRCSARAGF